MTYKTEFPDFVLDVEIPQGFADASWRNEICPSWINNTAGLVLFIDFKEPLDREFPDSPRFSLSRTDLVDGTKAMADLALTDDWSEVVRAIDAHTNRVLTQTMARRIFAKHLNSALAEVQRIVGEETGDLAGMYHDTWDNIVADVEYNARMYLIAQCVEKGWRYDVNG
jgi:hypothetical protein